MTDTHDRQRRAALITRHAQSNGLDRVASALVDRLVRTHADTDAHVAEAIAYMTTVSDDLTARSAMRTKGAQLGLDPETTAAVLAVAYSARPSTAAVTALLARIAGGAGVNNVH